MINIHVCVANMIGMILF